MTKYVRETPAGRAVSAWIILKGKKEIATVQAYYSKGGRCLVNVWNGNQKMQHASAGGSGYDKLTAALCGLEIDGHKLTDHCGGSLKPPRGKKFFPVGYKPPKGYSLANYGLFNEKGYYCGPHYWTEQAREELGESAAWEDIQRRAAELKAAANLMPGYSSCYRESGLRYLERIGYNVIQVI